VSPKKITDIVDQPTLKNFQYDVRSPAKSLMDHLRKDPNIDTVLLFGGGQINRMFYDEGLVDELSITICPVIIGTPDASRFVDPGLANPTLFQLQSSIVSENHVFLTYSVRKT
jgi:riboflavin biosynthesis pyrimidine reductase